LSSGEFLAIDFETADYGGDSACAIGLVRVKNGEILRSQHYFIRPPRKRVMFTYIHGIQWQDVEDKPHFGELWAELAPWFEGVEFVAAHNSGFDERVLRACCAAYGLPAPDLPFVCTVQLARKAWGIFPTKLPNVCRVLGIELKHHEALSDALACARIVIAAQKGTSVNPDAAPDLVPTGA
jgi:DNA polymerase-3 subunit epsilon